VNIKGKKFNILERIGLSSDFYIKNSSNSSAGFPPVGSKTLLFIIQYCRNLINKQTKKKTSVPFNWGGIQRKLVEAWGKLYRPHLTAPCFIYFTAQHKKKKKNEQN
jgi:hypothetical protein